MNLGKNRFRIVHRDQLQVQSWLGFGTRFGDCFQTWRNFGLSLGIAVEGRHFHHKQSRMKPSRRTFHHLDFGQSNTLKLPGSRMKPNQNDSTTSGYRGVCTANLGDLLRFVSLRRAFGLHSLGVEGYGD